MMKADGWGAEDNGTDIGINNVMQRLNLVFGNKATLVLKNDGGARTILILPLIFEDDPIAGKDTDTK